MIKQKLSRKIKINHKPKIHEKSALSFCRPYSIINYLVFGCLVTNSGVKMKFYYGMIQYIVSEIMFFVTFF